MTARMKIIVDGLRKRSKPSLTASTIIGYFRAGEIVVVEDNAVNYAGYRWRKLANARGWFAESGWGHTYAVPADDDGGAIVWDKKHKIVDASFWVRTINDSFWCALERQGVNGFIHRVTGQRGWVEPTAHDRIATARQFGMTYAGGYVWCDLTTPVNKGAEIVGKAIEAISPQSGKINIVALDAEHDPKNAGGRAEVRKNIAAMGRAILRAADKYPIVPVLYSVSGLWNGIYTAAPLPDWMDDPRWRWWVAAPLKGGKPASVFRISAVPRGWDTKRLWLWQYSWVGRLTGCPHNLDFSRVRK